MPSPSIIKKFFPCRTPAGHPLQFLQEHRLDPHPLLLPLLHGLFGPVPL